MPWAEFSIDMLFIDSQVSSQSHCCSSLTTWCTSTCVVACLLTVRWLVYSVNRGWLLSRQTLRHTADVHVPQCTLKTPEWAGLTHFNSMKRVKQKEQEYHHAMTSQVNAHCSALIIHPLTTGEASTAQTHCFHGDVTLWEHQAARRSLARRSAASRL